jgi:hypothetical protein
VMLRALGAGSALALACALVRVGFTARFHESPGALVLLACGALAGSVIHRSQLTLVKSWARTRPPPAPSDTTCPA